MSGGRSRCRDHSLARLGAAPHRCTLRAQALTELVRQALGIDPGTARGPAVEATLVVAADDLRTAVDAGGVPPADGATRVLLCDVELHPLIVDCLVVPLDLASRVRFATEHQRQAVRRCDGGCRS